MQYLHISLELNFVESEPDLVAISLIFEAHLKIKKGKINSEDLKLANKIPNLQSAMVQERVV